MARSAAPSGCRADLLKRLRLAIFRSDPRTSVCLRFVPGVPRSHRQPPNLIVAVERDAADAVERSQRSNPGEHVLILGDPDQLVSPLLPTLREARRRGHIGPASVFISRPVSTDPPDTLADALNEAGLTDFVTLFTHEQGSGRWSEVAPGPCALIDGALPEADCSATDPEDLTP